MTAAQLASLRYQILMEHRRDVRLATIAGDRAAVAGAEAEYAARLAILREYEDAHNV